MSMWTKIGSVVIACAFLAAGAANGQTPKPPGAPAGAATATAKPADSEYVLGPDDVIEYEVLGTNDKSRERIYTDGTFQTNLAGRITASGKTPRQLAAELSEKLKAGGYYADPVVNVEVVGYASRYVTVLGAVTQPGLVPVTKTLHLSEIIARVGGVRGDGADYVVVQPADGQETRYIVDKIAMGGPKDDPVVEPGGKIFVPAAEQFYIAGQVKAPGAYPLKTGMTIAQAIARGGGLTDSGTDKKVKVRRGGKNVTLTGDAEVQAGDVLTIGERLF